MDEKVLQGNLPCRGVFGMHCEGWIGGNLGKKAQRGWQEAIGSFAVWEYS